jgi:hypothetical protein
MDPNLEPVSIVKARYRAYSSALGWNIRRDGEDKSSLS